VTTPAYKITEDMLMAAAKVDDLDDAVRGVMDQVGITTGDVAGIVLTSYQDEWADLDYWGRLAALREWRDVEQVRNIDYANIEI